MSAYDSYSEVGGYGRLPQLPHEVIEKPQLDMTDILAVQSLIMGYLRGRSRTRLTDTQAKRYGLCMFDSGSEPSEVTYDGSTDSFMTCVVKKPRHDQWHMAVSFTQSLNTEETKEEYTRELYSFDWLRNGNRAAWVVEKKYWNEEIGSFIQVINAEPLTACENDQLQDRMLEHAQRVNPMEPGSIFVPRLGERT